MSVMNTKNIKFTIGGPESSAGTVAARTKVLPIRDLPSFRDQAEKVVDPAITGLNMVAGEYLGALDLSGGLPLSPRPAGGFGMILNSLLGQEVAPVQIGAVARIRYNGAQPSAKIVANASTKKLISAIGNFGDETSDATFGTGGEIDLENASTDTVAKLVTVVNAYNNYNAEVVTGLGAVSAGSIVAITAEQGKGRWVYLYFTSADSGLYLHRFPTILTDSARPTYSVQGDGVHDNFVGVGVGVSQLTVSGALKAMVEAEATLQGFTWTPGAVASVVALEPVAPFLYYSGSFSINGVTQPFVRNVSFDISNNLDAEGYGMGSASRQYHDKGQFEVTSQVQLRYTADAYALYGQVQSNAQAGLDVYFKTPSAMTAGIHGLMVIEAPYCNVSSYEPTDNNGVLDASIDLRAIAPPGAYGSPFRISLITADAGAY
jgi:hypothetical protein